MIGTASWVDAARKTLRGIYGAWRDPCTPHMSHSTESRDTAADLAASTSTKGPMSSRARKSRPAKKDAAQMKPTASDAAGQPADAAPPNPARTTTGGWFTAPKFGSAGSGGAELEPGPERD